MVAGQTSILKGGRAALCITAKTSVHGPRATLRLVSLTSIMPHERPHSEYSKTVVGHIDSKEDARRLVPNPD